LTQRGRADRDRQQATSAIPTGQHQLQRMPPCRFARVASSNAVPAVAGSVSIDPHTGQVRGCLQFSHCKLCCTWTYRLDHAQAAASTVSAAATTEGPQLFDRVPRGDVRLLRAGCHLLIVGLDGENVRFHSQQLAFNTADKDDVFASYSLLGCWSTARAQCARRWMRLCTSYVALLSCAAYGILLLAVLRRSVSFRMPRTSCPHRGHHRPRQSHTAKNV